MAPHIFVSWSFFILHSNLNFQVEKGDSSKKLNPVAKKNKRSRPMATEPRQDKTGTMTVRYCILPTMA